MKEIKPKNLEESLDALIKNTDITELKRFAENNETDAISTIHHGFGTAIRNN